MMRPVFEIERLEFISVICAVVKPDYRDSGNYYKAFITTDQVFSMALIYTISLQSIKNIENCFQYSGADVSE